VSVITTTNLGKMTVLVSKEFHRVEQLCTLRTTHSISRFHFNFSLTLVQLEMEFTGLHSIHGVP
jgi:hypothetical protein